MGTAKKNQKNIITEYFPSTKTSQLNHTPSLQLIQPTGTSTGILTLVEHNVRVLKILWMSDWDKTQYSSCVVFSWVMDDVIWFYICIKTRIVWLPGIQLFQTQDGAETENPQHNSSYMKLLLSLYSFLYLCCCLHCL